MSASRILIVDDDPALLTALSGALALRMPDVAVESCDSAIAAIQRISQSEFDAVVTDIKMPGMDGLALLKEIRQLQPELPTLLITGHGQHDLAVQALRGGAFDFIQKPIDRDYFVASLARAIRVRKMDRQLQRQKRALENHAAELEQAVQVRTEQLCEASRRKDEFLAMLSHELRNPLACILSSAELALIDERDPSAAIESCRVIVQQAQHMRILLDDLLDLSRISRNKIELRRENLLLDRIVETALTSVRPAIHNRGHELIVSVDEALAGEHIYADATRLEQVIVNLLNNAAKYTEPGGEILFSVWRDENDVVLRVQDNGEGIPASVLPNIFEPFVQADGTRRRANSGLGIGLALVRQLVQLHGGSVTALSDGEGKGSCFTVRLPIGVEEPIERFAAIAASGQEHSPTRSVMLVEDQESLSKLTALILERQGHRVVAVASDGPSAINLALVHRPDLILMDIGLPGMDGFEIARQMREFPQLDGTTLVAVTGYGSAEDRRRAKDAGFEYHLVKPCSVECLADCLRQPLRSERAVGSAPCSANGPKRP